MQNAGIKSITERWRGIELLSFSSMATTLTEVWIKKMNKSKFKIHEETFMKCGYGAHNGIEEHQPSEIEIGVELWVEFQCFL